MLAARIAALFAAGALAGCVTEVYHPGTADNPLHSLRLGQSYGDMVRQLGMPSQSVSEDRSGKSAAAASIPIVGLVTVATNSSPSSLQSYHYDHIGTVAIDNSNRIVRIEADAASPPPRAAHGDVAASK